MENKFVALQEKQQHIRNVIHHTLKSRTRLASQIHTQPIWNRGVTLIKENGNLIASFLLPGTCPECYSGWRSCRGNRCQLDDPTVGCHPDRGCCWSPLYLRIQSHPGKLWRKRSFFISKHSKYIILIESSFVRNIDGSCCHCGSIDLLLRNALGILSKLGLLFYI